MVPPQLRDSGLQQSSTATGASRPPHPDVPNGDTTTTPNLSVTTTPDPSVMATPNPSVAIDHSVTEGSLPKTGSESEPMRIIDEAQNETIATDQAFNKLKSSNDATRKHQVNFADSIEYPRGNTILPPGFCSQCLARHPFKSGKRTYHIRSFRENLEMHEAISLGKLSKVDPWEAIVKEFKPPSPKPEPEQAQEQPDLFSRTLSEAGERYFESAREGLSGTGQMYLLLDILKTEYHAEQRMQSAIPAQQAPEAQRSEPYATAATTGGYSSHYPLPTYQRPRSPQPTGPPPKKKRKAGNTDEGSRRAAKGARFGSAHTAVMQGAGGQRTSAAQTPQPTTNPAFNTDPRQRASSDPLDNVTRTGQTKSLNITNVPTTGASPPAKGEAAAAKKATDEAAQQAADNVAAAKKAAPNNKPT